METVDWHKWFLYDEVSPSGLVWKVDRVSGKYGNQVHVKAGDVAGCVNSSGYFQVKLNHKLISCHRVIYEMFTDEVVGKMFIDHMDRNKLNNKYSNLRKVERKYNARNATKRTDNTSGFTGVCKIGNGCGQFYWSARCEGLDGKIIQRRFSIEKLGNDYAYAAACTWRSEQIVLLNADGAGYTSDHGQT